MRASLLEMVAALVLVFLATVARGMDCDPHNPCIANGMCTADGTCDGTKLNSGSCEVPQADTLCKETTGTCVNGVCMSNSAPVGTSCSAGCGTCQKPIPEAPTVLCSPLATLPTSCIPDLGNPDLVKCFVGKCQVFGTGQFQVASCFPMEKQCPDVDHNPCTADVCDPSDGQCKHFDEPPCIPECETCNPTTGQCQPANIGAPCTDLGECPLESSCQVLQGRGVCLAGTPSKPSPTPTQTHAGASPTPTVTSHGNTPTPTVTEMIPTSTPTLMGPTSTPTMRGPTPTRGKCVGDCNVDGIVEVNELVLGERIMLNPAKLSLCPVFDLNTNDHVDIDEFLLSVDGALNGCTP